MAWRDETTYVADELEDVGAARGGEPLHDFGDFLSAIAGADEEGVGSFHDDEIIYPEGGDKFCGTPEKIAISVDGATLTGENSRDFVASAALGQFPGRASCRIRSTGRHITASCRHRWCPRRRKDLCVAVATPPRS